jgi:hypothetical protein
MTSLTLSPADDCPRLRRGSPARLVAAASRRWRVIDRRGRIVGHLDAVADPRGVRYRARRYHPTARAFVDVGEFWSPDDAVASLM